MKEFISLIKPEKSHKSLVKEYIKEHLEVGESDIHGGALVEKMGFEAWLKQLADNSDKSTVQDNWVISTTFLAIRKSDGKMVGIIDIRHELNDFLASYGGHIGLGVLPSERGKAYATQILKEGLNYCKSIGLKKVMLACHKDNSASRNTIIKCGGVLENEFPLSEVELINKEKLACTRENNTDCDKIVQVFWITL